MKKEKKQTSSFELFSILDINSSNIWSLSENEIANLWEISRKNDELAGSESKLLNIIRLAFDVFHYNPKDPRDVERFENNGLYAKFSRNKESDGRVAVRKREIRRITDITYETVKHLDTQQLLALISDNFGGGWDAISLQIQDIISTGFEVSTTTLPAKRLHAPGGTLEKKLADGFEVLEVKKGCWTEAIFVKKKDPLEKLHAQNEGLYDEDGNRIQPSDDEDLSEIDEKDSEKDDDDESLDENFYGTFIPEAETKDEEEDSADF